MSNKFRTTSTIYVSGINGESISQKEYRLEVWKREGDNEKHPVWVKDFYSPQADSKEVAAKLMCDKYDVCRKEVESYVKQNHLTVFLSKKGSGVASKINFKQQKGALETLREMRGILGDMPDNDFQELLNQTKQ